MRYALALLTMPRREGTLQRTLDSFQTHVTPRPSELLAYTDGDVTIPLLYNGALDWNLSGAKRQGGFCRATRNLWKHAATAEADWIFWLEDDFEFTRIVDLRDLACTLEGEPQVAQMALYRQPVNSEEIAAGGYIAAHPEEYVRKGGGSAFWWEHVNHWTTNPSLFRREICATQEWPDGPFCEGKFGFRIRENRPGTTFGIWGAGDPWITHIGVREGQGY